MKEEIFKIDTAGSEKTIAQLRKELKEAKSALANATQGTEEYNKALQTAANITDKLGDLQQLVNRTSTGMAGKMASVSGALRGVSGAANAVIGTMSLLGVENDELQKKLNNSITALIGITQGLGAIGPAVKSFKELKVWVSAATVSFSSLKKALISSGIGALVVAVGTLIAYKDDIKEFFNKYIKGHNNAAKEVSKHREELDKLKNSMKGESDKTIWEILTADVKRYNDEIARTPQLLKANAEKEIEALKAQRTEWSKCIAARRKYFSDNPEEQKLIKKYLEDAEAQFNILDEEIRLKQAILVAYDNNLKNQASNTEETVKSNDKLGSSIKKVTSIFDEFINEVKESSKEIENFELRAAFNFLKNIGLTDEEIKQLGDRLGNDVLKVIKYMRDTYGERFEKELQISEKLDIEVTVPKVAKPEDADISKLLENTAKAAKKYDQEQILRQEKIKKNYNEINKTLYAQGQLFAVLEDVFAENEEASKAMAIASIISDTAAAIMGTWAGYANLGAWGAVAAAIQTAAIAATGALQISNVKNQTIKAGNAPTIPEVKTSAVQQSNYQGGDYRVYVTETDITNTQNRVKVIENGARY